MATKYRVIKVKGMEPEAFVVVGIDFDEHAIKSTSQVMSLDGLSSHLRESGATDDQVGAWIEQARAYPG